MLPISIITDEIDQDLSRCREFLDRHRIRAIELRTVSGRRVPELRAGDRQTLLEWSADGIEVVAVSPGLFKCAVDDRATIDHHVDEVLPRAIELARELNARHLITFSFDNENGAPAPDHSIVLLREAAARCEEAGLTLLLENEPGYLAQTAIQIDALLEAVGHPALHVNWDPRNSNQCNDAQLRLATELLAPRVRNVHVKNGRREPAERFARCGPLMAGEIDWSEHLFDLWHCGYRGHLCVETHFEPLPDASDVVVTELRRILEALSTELSG